eukprot:scaffold3999_cov138-Skeletonema_dohrnii-CCMP3373.AAC.29
MKLSAILVLFTTAVVGIASAAETTDSGNLRAIVDSASILKQDDSKEDRIATMTYADGVKHCTDPGKVSQRQASNLSRNEVQAKVDACIEQAINVATAGNSTQRSTLDPPTDCVHKCGDKAASSFKQVSKQCSGSLDKCKSCKKKKEKACSMGFMNFKKDEEKDISKKDADTDEDEQAQKDLAKCIKDKEKEEKKYMKCEEEKEECEEDRDNCEEEQEKALKSLERMPKEFVKCIEKKCSISDTFSAVKMA